MVWLKDGRQLAFDLQIAPPLLTTIQAGEGFYRRAHIAWHWIVDAGQPMRLWRQGFQDVVLPQVLHALEHHLMEEESVRIFYAEYAAERNRLQAARSAGRADFEKDLARAITDHKTLVGAIIAGVPADQVKDRMIELDARRKALERLLSATPAPDPVRIHPGMAWTYRARIGQLIAGLSEAGQMDEAREALRGLIETLELVPVAADEGDTGRPGLAIHLHGALASLLRLACGLPVQDVSGGVGQMQKAPRGAGRGDGICSQSGGADLQDIDEISVGCGGRQPPSIAQL
jgi:site-specific DNA recombinase